MRVKHLIIIVLDPRDVETAAGARALYMRYRTRGEHRPESIAMVWLDAMSEEYKKGRQSEANDRTLFGALNVNRCVPNDYVTALLGRIGSMVTDDGRVGVYVIGHGNGEYMTSNTKPVHLAIIFHKLGITRIDKLVILSCKLGQPERVKLGMKQLSFVQALCHILAKQSPSQKSPTKAEKLIFDQYAGPPITPKVAGWDALISTYFPGASATYTPAQHSTEDAGRKVTAQGEWGSDAQGLKLAFQVTERGLQPLDAPGWSDDPASINQ